MAMKAGVKMASMKIWRNEMSAYQCYRNISQSVEETRSANVAAIVAWQKKTRRGGVASSGGGIMAWLAAMTNVENGGNQRRQLWRRGSCKPPSGFGIHLAYYSNLPYICCEKRPEEAVINSNGVAYVGGYKSAVASGQPAYRLAMKWRY
jgi:hypothetical protein